MRRDPQPFLSLGCGSTGVAVVDFKFVDMYFSTWGEVAKSIVKVAYEQGLIAFDKVSEFDSEQLVRCAGHSHAALIFGGNARERTVRAEKLFGYYASRPPIFEDIPQVVPARLLGWDLLSRKEVGIGEGEHEVRTGRVEQPRLGHGD